MAAYQGRKYRKLYSHLCGLTTGEWRVSFTDIEAVIGNKLPPSARRYQAWWANGSAMVQEQAWKAAGWKTADVNMTTETLLFRREDIYAPDGQSVTTDDALAALDKLQTTLAERGVDLAGWAQELRAERRGSVVGV